MFREKSWFTKGNQQQWNQRLKDEGVEEYNAQKKEGLNEPENIEGASNTLSLPEGLFSTEELTNSPELQEAAYYAYSRAMSRRGRTPLGKYPKFRTLNSKLPRLAFELS